MQNRSLRFQDARFFAVVVFGLFGDPAAAADQRTIDMWLSQAGFVMKQALFPLRRPQRLQMCLCRRRDGPAELSEHRVGNAAATRQCPGGRHLDGTDC
jgi:hypothetical protein